MLSIRASRISASFADRLVILRGPVLVAPRDGQGVEHRRLLGLGPQPKPAPGRPAQEPAPQSEDQETTHSSEWQQVPRHRHPPKGGASTSRGRQASQQQQWVPTGNRFSVLQEEPAEGPVEETARQSTSRPDPPAPAIVTSPPSSPLRPPVSSPPVPSPPSTHPSSSSATPRAALPSTPTASPLSGQVPTPPGSARRSLQSVFLASRAAQAGSSSPRPPVVVSTSSLAAILLV